MGNGAQAEPLLERLVFQVTQGIAGETGTRFFESLVRNLAHALPADFVFAGALKPGARRIVALASFGDAAELPPHEFDLAETPFRNVTTERPEPFSFAASAAERFPNDPILRKIPGDGYVGAPLMDSAGNFVGLMSAITRRRLEDAELAREAIRIFSALAAKELERVRHIESLERQNAELRRAAEAKVTEARGVGEARVTEEGAGAKSHLERDIVYLRDEIRSAHPAGIGNSQEFLALMSHVRRVAGTSAIVLIQGESGSGKELAARAIHNLSTRRNRPLVKLDCAGMPPEALEVELFGGLRSPQSEASPRIGRLDFADGGTLLIDEVAALPLDLQAKLLRVIQQREFRPLGFQRTLKIDVRLLATTNRDLNRAVEEGSFRSDLYQRLLVDPLRVPPLRRRRQDIPLLTERFLGFLKNRLGRKDLVVSERMMSQMMTYVWPGNIRELEQLLFRAALSGQDPLDVPVQTDGAWLEPLTLEDAERHHVNRTLAACNWVIEGPRGAAAVLNVPPSTLRSLMKRLKIQRAGKAGTPL